MVLIIAAVFAWTGGTFSERSYLAIRREEAADSLKVRQLEAAVDSLKRFRDSLATYPSVQERVAREQWGMQRPGEVTFTILRDSAPTGKKP